MSSYNNNYSPVKALHKFQTRNHSDSIRSREYNIILYIPKCGYHRSIDTAVSVTLGLEICYLRRLIIINFTIVRPHTQYSFFNVVGCTRAGYPLANHLTFYAENEKISSVYSRLVIFALHFYSTTLIINQH